MYFRQNKLFRQPVDIYNRCNLGVLDNGHQHTKISAIVRWLVSGHFRDITVFFYRRYFGISSYSLLFSLLFQWKQVIEQYKPFSLLYYF